MKWRLAVLVLLAFLTLDYRGMALYMKYFSPDTSTRATYSADYQDGAMIVHAVEKKCPAPEGQHDQCLTSPHKGDRIVAVYDGSGMGGRIRGLFTYGHYLRPIGAKEGWTMVVDRPLPSGEFHRLHLSMPPAIPFEWSAKEWMVNLGFDLYLPLLALAAGLFIGFLRPNNEQAFLAAVVFLGFSTSFGQPVAQFSPVWREMALFFQTTAAVFSPWIILRFFLRFPRRSPLDRRLPWLSPAVLALTTVAWAVELAARFTLHVSFPAYESFLQAMASVGMSQTVRDIFFKGLWVALVVLALGSLVMNMRRASSMDDRRRTRIILGGAAAGLVPLIVLYVPAWPKEAGPPTWILALCIVIIGLFPLSFVYAIVKHRIFGIRLIIRRGLQYALVSWGFLVLEGVASFLALYFFAGPLLARLLPEAGTSLSTVGAAAVTLGLVLGTRRVNRRVLPAIDRRFFRDVYNAQRILTQLGRAVRTLASNPRSLLEKATAEIAAALHPEHVAVFLADRPWPKLEPASPDDPVCWEADTEGLSDKRFVLYMERSAATGRRDREPYRRLRLRGAASLSKLLASSVATEPEALELLDDDDNGRVARRRRVEPAGGECRSDRDLFHRFNARLVVPMVTVGKVVGFLVLGQKLSEEHYTLEDRELLLAVAEQMAIALDYSHLIGQVAAQEKLEREVQIAQEVQARLLPQGRLSLRTLRYAGACRSARRVGGDYYDFVRVGPDRVGISVADIAGKGLPAALLMASLQALVRGHVPALGNRLGELAAEVNRHLCESTDDARFATFFFGVYDDSNRTLRYLNAGHNPPVLLRADGTAERLEAGGMVLGAFAEQVYHDRQVQLWPGDLLLIYSDGVVEAGNEDGEEFGERRLIEATRRLAGQDGEDGEDGLVERILEEVCAFCESDTPQDDVTLIVARAV